MNLKGLDEENTDADSYTSASIPKRMAIILAGGLINILFALVIYFILIVFMVGVDNAFMATGDFGLSIFKSLKMLVTGEVGIDQFMGPIGISSIVSETKGLAEFIYLLAVVSLSLGVTNLLPVPPLDGFKFFLLLIEAFRKKPFTKNFEYSMQFLGFLLLLILSIYIAYHDIVRFF